MTKYAVFMDLLGFRPLVASNPGDADGLVWETDNGYERSLPSPWMRRMDAFHAILDRASSQSTRARPQGQLPSHRLLFSDCAYLLFDNPLFACLSAMQVMIESLFASIPIRMGVACGTATVSEFSTQQRHQLTTKSMFAGTAFSDAYAAESCGLAGCRIFISRRAGEALAVEEPLFLLPLAVPLRDVSHELNYLMFPEYLKPEPFLAAVDQMAVSAGARSEPRILEQYSETTAALHRMIEAWHRAQPDIGSVSGPNLPRC